MRNSSGGLNIVTRNGFRRFREVPEVPGCSRVLLARSVSVRATAGRTRNLRTSGTPRNLRNPRNPLASARASVILSYDSDMIFQLNFRAGKAVYLQVVDQVKVAAASGTIHDGES